MSEENVELVRAIHKRAGRDESMRDLVAEDLEYVNPGYAVETGTRIGRDAFGSIPTPTPTSSSAWTATSTPATTRWSSSAATRPQAE